MDMARILRQVSRQKIKNGDVKMNEKTEKLVQILKLSVRRFIWYFIFVTLLWIVVLTIVGSSIQFSDNILYKKCIESGESAETCLKNIRF